MVHRPVLRCEADKRFAGKVRPYPSLAVVSDEMMLTRSRLPDIYSRS